MHNCISVTVISDSAVIADAYSTALFLLKPKEAIALAKKVKGLEAVIFYIKKNRIFYMKTNGMDKYFFKIVDNRVKEDI